MGADPNRDRVHRERRQQLRAFGYVNDWHLPRIRRSARKNSVNGYHDGGGAVLAAGGCITASRRFVTISASSSCSGGDPRDLLLEVVRNVKASAVFWNRCYEPFAIARDKELKISLQERGIEV